MKRLCVLACALALAAGCASPGPFEDALKDLRGDNMRMRSATSVQSDDTPSLRPR